MITAKYHYFVALGFGNHYFLDDLSAQQEQKIIFFYFLVCWSDRNSVLLIQWFDDHNPEKQHGRFALSLNLESQFPFISKLGFQQFPGTIREIRFGL